MDPTARESVRSGYYGLYDQALAIAGGGAHISEGEQAIVYALLALTEQVQALRKDMSGGWDEDQEDFHEPAGV